MINTIKKLIPMNIRIRYNQYKNKKSYDVIFGKHAHASDTYFEGRNLVNNSSYLSESHIGFGTYISGRCTLAKIKIGKFCSIGENVNNYYGIHPSKDFVSTHPAFYSLRKQAGFTYAQKTLINEHKYIEGNNKFVVSIGNDVWIGNNVMLLDGISVGDGAIIAAGSIVIKDIKPYTINGGIPTKIIKKRFTDEQIEFLLDHKWWNNSIKWIKDNSEYFHNIELFMEKVGRVDRGK